MKVLVALCLLAVGVSADYGESGIVYPDGRLVQFTPEEAANIAEIGESGVVRMDGTHLQFDQDFAFHHAKVPPAPMPVRELLMPFGYDGIVYPHGKNVQFTPERSANTVLVGPSGAVMADGKNVQLDGDGLPVRKKRSPSEAVVWESGLITPKGKLIQFPYGVKVVSDGPSGAVLSDGNNVQYRRKRAYGAVVGDSGLITPDGQLIQLEPGVTVVSAGPSGAVLSNGKTIQYSRKKRAATSKATVGESAIITPGGKMIQFPHGVYVVVEGPSGAQLSDGSFIQYEF